MLLNKCHMHVHIATFHHLNLLVYYTWMAYFLFLFCPKVNMNQLTHVSRLGKGCLFYKINQS